jgi:hypothetical protein
MLEGWLIRGSVMKHFILIALLALVSLNARGATKSGDVFLLGEYQRHDIRVTSMCIEKHVVVVSHSDVGQGGGLQMIQIQHVVDGKIVPMKCDLSQKIDSGKK